MNKEKVKVYFILPTLFAGGAERIISFVSQQMDKTKFNVTLIIIGYEKDDNTTGNIKANPLYNRYCMHHNHLRSNSYIVHF